MKILIVEDNLKLALTYKTILDHSFDIEIAYDLKTAKKMLVGHKYDVVLLDIMLPDGNGYDIIPIIKKETSALVIMISALDKESERRIAYEKGADDYMIKPITLFELEYKLLAISKRTKSDQLIFRIGDITFDFENMTLSSDFDQIQIQYSQALLLKMLYDKYLKGDILHKNELVNLESIEKTDNFRIHTMISRLRKNIEDVESEKIILENVYGKGYRLVVMP